MQDVRSVKDFATVDRKPYAYSKVPFSFSFFLFSFFHERIMLTATGLTVVHKEHTCMWSEEKPQAIRSYHQQGQFSVSQKTAS
jgi:hypothetical protein